jgi:hypothetical protein
VREVEDARGTNSSTGEGAASTEVAAANAAIALKVFMIGGQSRQIGSYGKKMGSYVWIRKGLEWDLNWFNCSNC